MKRAVLLGLFDSVHIGHIKTVEALCRTDAGEKLVYTFNLLSLDTKGERTPLITEAYREKLLLDAGAHRVISVDFAAVRGLSPEEFVENILIGELGADIVIAGENFRFGRNAAGDMNALRALCNKRGVSVISVPLERDSEGVISTTRIRALLEEGNIIDANRLLGRRYAITGEITHGKALGREWGIRTVNLEYDGCLKCGVYSTTAEINGKKYKSVTNVGYKPTVSDGKNKNAETHILDFDAEVYGERVTVEFNAFYRGEEKFPDRESLISAITKDINIRKDEI